MAGQAFAESQGANSEYITANHLALTDESHDLVYTATGYNGICENY